MIIQLCAKLVVWTHHEAKSRKQWGLRPYYDTCYLSTANALSKDLIFLKNSLCFNFSNIYLVGFFFLENHLPSCFWSCFSWENKWNNIRNQVLIEKHLVSMGKWRERARLTPAEWVTGSCCLQPEKKNVSWEAGKQPNAPNSRPTGFYHSPP